MTFKYKDVTTALSTNDVTKNVSFGIFPNPAPNKEVRVVYDVKNVLESKSTITVFDLFGKNVYSTEISKTQGFFRKDLTLHYLSAGTYLVNLNVGGFSEPQKLIIK